MRTSQKGKQPLEEVIGRRDFLKGTATGGMVIAGVSVGASGCMPRAMGGPLDFQPLSLNGDDRVMVSEGYEAQVLLRWGDPVLKGSPEFRVDAQTRASQEMQFGYNCDYAAYLPLMTLPGDERGLLFVNHEYTLGDLMFPGYISGTPTKNQVEVEIAAHGASVVEIRRTGDGWKPVMDSPYNRRITGYTAMDISGPAKGHPLLRTAEDPTGTKVTGMFNNCGGGKTPWGTVLTAEENFNQYFGNAGDLAVEQNDIDVILPLHWRVLRTQVDRCATLQKEGPESFDRHGA